MVIAIVMMIVMGTMMIEGTRVIMTALMIVDMIEAMTGTVARKQAMEEGAEVAITGPDMMMIIMTMVTRHIPGGGEADREITTKGFTNLMTLVRYNALI